MLEERLWGLPAEVKKTFSYQYCYSAVLKFVFIIVFDYKIK